MRLQKFLPIASILTACTIFAVGYASPASTTFTQQNSFLQITQLDNKGISISARLSDVKFSKDSGSIVNIDLEGEGRIGQPGYPDLPAISRLFVVPPTGGINLTYNTSNPKLIEYNDIPIFPALNSDGQTGSFAVDKYDRTNAFWPKEVVLLDKPVIMRGVRMVRVTIYPVQVNPATGESRTFDEIQVSLDFSEDDGENPVERPERKRPSGAALKAMASIVANPELLRDDYREKGAFVYVVPNFNGVAEAISPLVQLRQMQGYPTQVITVAANASNVDVKNAIQAAYDDWEVPPEIICLVGEADLVNADFMIPTWDVGRAYMWETDFKYGLLEGQDLIPEAAVGRISVRSLNELRTLVAKIAGYELNPYLEDSTWFTKGAVMANDDRTGYSSIYLQRWARKLMLEVGFTEVDTFYFIHQNQESDHNFIRRTINQGISIFNYRGWGQFNGAWSVGNVAELRNDRKLPLLILPTCNTCDFADHILAPHAYAEDFLWAQNGGAIGTIGSSGFTHTNYNNVLDGGVLNSFYRDDIYSIGWALNRGKLELYRHFGMFNDVQDPQVQNLLVWEAHCYQFNLIGDPGTELWTAIPQHFSVSTEDTLIVGEQNLLVSVSSEGNNIPIPEAVVTLFQEGEPIRTVPTDANGDVMFTFSPDELIGGNLILGVTKHNMVPSVDTLIVQTGAQFVAARSVIIDDDNAGRSRGNGDRTANPGETIELRAYIANYGESAPQGVLDATLTPNEGDYQIVTGNARLNQAPASGDSAVVTFVVAIGSLVHNGQRLVFNLSITSGNQSWNSTIAITAGSFDLEYASHNFTPDPFRPGDTAWVDLTIRNIGAITSPQMTARITSLTPVVSVFNPEAAFAPVSVDGNDSLATARFRIYSHDLTVPGTKAELLITFESQTGMRDTTSFEYTISAPNADTPFGPDNYGYVCFDNTDTRWEVAPEYNWIEIDTGLGGSGQNTDIRDRGNEQDWSVLVDIPFSFQYYGQDFEELTICSNGWFAFGDESKLADFQNRRIPPALGPRAQVCVFWDDLINFVDQNGAQIGGVFYKNDEENHRFIIEWSRMRRYIGMENGQIRVGSEESFQAIIYDPQHYQSYTGDGEIVLQYRDVSNDAAVDPGEFDTPYATVGIVNLSGTDGMEYTYWNNYTPGAAVLADGRAIKFSTKLIVVVGYARGVVLDAATNQPIPNAEISGSRGSFTISDRNGRFFMNNILIGEDYNFTARAPGYNDSTLSGYDIVEGDTISLQFALLHPTFTISHDEISAAIQPEYGTNATILLKNEGNGLLTYASRLAYSGVVEEGRWPLVMNINVTDSTNDNRIQSVFFFDHKIWVAGSNNNVNPNRFYQFLSDGAYRYRYDQPGSSNYGIRGSTSDETHIYGGEGSWIYKIDGSGLIVDSIPGPLTLQRALAFDTDNDRIWVANGRGEQIVCIDLEGEVIAAYDHELDINGLAFFPDDPDGFTVYMLSRDRTNPGLQVPEALISKLNPLTGEIRIVTVLEGDVEDHGGEIEITSNLDSRKWILLTIMTNASGSRVSTFDIGPNTTWLEYSPRFGTLSPRQEDTIQVRLDAAGLAEGEYDLILRYKHNAAGLQTDIPVNLTVDNEAWIDDPIETPLDFSLSPAYPNPFNSMTVIHFSLPEAGQAKLGLFDLAGREVMSLREGRFNAGNHTAVLSAEDLPSGIYIVKLNAGTSSRSTKLALIR